MIGDEGQPDVVRLDGISFERYASPSKQALRGIWVSELWTVYAVGDGGVIVSRRSDFSR